MKKLYIAVLCFGLAFGGCEKKILPPSLTPTEAQKHFEAKCRSEYGMDVSTRMVGKTLWIYLPIKEPIFDLKADKKSLMDATKKPAKFNLQYLEAVYANRAFTVEYDIVDKKKSNIEDYGYHNDYTEAFSKKQNNLFTVITESLFDVKPTPKNPVPVFVVMSITDITKGIEVKYTFYLEDFKKFSSEALPFDEYNKRFLQDVKGGQDMIGDEIGDHLDYKDVVMGEFLARQMVNRIRFKFQQSDNPPEDSEHDNLIAGTIGDTTRFYAFKDFDEARLSNLRTGLKFIFDQNQLKAFAGPDEKKPEDGKLIHIRFENGKANFADLPAESANAEINKTKDAIDGKATSDNNDNTETINSIDLNDIIDHREGDDHKDTPSGVDTPADKNTPTEKTRNSSKEI